MEAPRRPKPGHLDALLGRLDEQALLLELFEDSAGVDRLLEGIEADRCFPPAEAEKKIA